MFIKGNNSIPKNIRNILLIQLGDIGDVVLSFPCVRALRENFPQANIVVAVREKAKELIKDCKWATDVIAINNSKKRWYQKIGYQKDFFLRLRKFHFDLAVDMRTGTRGAILAFLSGARQRIGFYAADGKLWRNKVFTHLAMPEIKVGCHMVEYNLSLLAEYGIKTENIRPVHDILVRKHQIAAALFRKYNIPSNRPVVAIQPFSLWKYKEWGVDKYIQLINQLISEYNVTVIITGSSVERARAEKIAGMCGNGVYNLAGETSIGMLAAVLKACRLFIGADSAGVHISAAVGTPTVSIFGPAATFAWAPKGKEHCVVQKKLPCVPCNLKGCQGGGISRCLEELTVEEVIPVVKGQIDRLLGFV